MNVIWELLRVLPQKDAYEVRISFVVNRCANLELLLQVFLTSDALEAKGRTECTAIPPPPQ